MRNSNMITLPLIKDFPKSGLTGVHTKVPGKWLVEEVRHHYNGRVNSISYLCNRKISELILQKVILKQYSKYEKYIHKSETVIVIDNQYIIIDMYPDPDDHTSKPRYLLLYKDGMMYIKDVRRIMNSHLTKR